jgi:FMN reductase
LSEKIRVAGLGGSLAPVSTSLAALRIALEGAQEAGAETSLFDLKEMDLPMYIPRGGVIDATRSLVEAVYEAEAMLWSSPVYEGSFSGAFKNALDHIHEMGSYDPPMLRGKVVGHIATGSGTNAVQGIIAMEACARSLHAMSVPPFVVVPKTGQAFDEEGKAIDPDMDQQLRSLGRSVVEAVTRLRGQGS